MEEATTVETHPRYTRSLSEITALSRELIVLYTRMHSLKERIAMELTKIPPEHPEARRLGELLISVVRG
jgi:hypothetical protein